MIKERNNQIKCQWCEKYRSKTWQESPLDMITIDSIGTSKKKLVIDGYLNQQPVKIYVDSGSDRNLIADSLVDRLGIPRIVKKTLLVVSSIASMNTGTTITHETDHLPVTVANRTEDIKFDILDPRDCDILLGHPWLEKYNPMINWKTKEITWEKNVSPKL